MVRLFVAVAALCLGAACGGDDAMSEAATAAKSDPPAVAVKDFAFAPRQLTVREGTEVTWTNGDEFDHSVVIDDLDLDGPNFGQNAAFRHTFAEAGTYPYFCGVHNSMTGTVIVTA